MSDKSSLYLERLISRLSYPYHKYDCGHFDKEKKPDRFTFQKHVTKYGYTEEKNIILQPHRHFKRAEHPVRL